MTWHFNNHKNEVYAYDLLGILYYYLGDTKKSQYYHQRMAEGHVELPESEIKKICLVRY